MPELSGVDDISRRRRRYHRGKIQNVEDIEQVGANRESGSFAQERLPLQADTASTNFAE
jgi:hypothetical protein